MNNQLTVLIPTSPIPSHPSTAILDETIANIRKYTDALIVILGDGIHQSLESRRDDYAKYLKTVDRKIRSGEYVNTYMFTFQSHCHQAIMTREALVNFVTTPLIMFCEHDTSPIGEINFFDICLTLLYTKELNYIRFNIFEKIPDEHMYLMIDRPTVYGVSYRHLLTRTIQWSQRPHIAKTDWYRDILQKYFKPDEKTMIEDVMHGVVQTEYDRNGKVDTFGLAIYTPPGNQLRSYHSDGRGTDEKIITG